MKWSITSELELTCFTVYLRNNLDKVASENRQTQTVEFDLCKDAKACKQLADKVMEGEGSAPVNHYIKSTKGGDSVKMFCARDRY